MPATVNDAGCRKVRCPKCTSLLTEPQTQIYECPICSTLLLARGYSIVSNGRSSENRLHTSSRDAEDIRRSADGASKLEKTRLNDEYGKEQVQQGMDFVEKKGKTFEQTDGPPPSDFLYESTDTVFKFPPEGDLSSDLEDQSLSRRKFLGQRTDPVDGLAPKNNVLLFEMPPYPPYHRRPSHHFTGSGGSSDKSEERNRFSELDSASHSESEIDVDSPIWSSENANASGVLEAKPAASKIKGSRPVESSGENPIMPGQSSGIASDLEVVGDRAYMQQEEGEYLERHEFDVRSRDGGTEEETEHVERHQRWSPDGATDEKVPKVEGGLVLDSRTGNDEGSDIIISRESFVTEIYTINEQNYPEVADSKEIDRSHSSSTEFKDEEVANSRDTERLQGSLVDLRFKNEARDDIRHSLSDKNPIEVGNDRYIGKVQSSLFDLSVLRIYDEDKYLEMRHGKEADYSTLSGNSSKGRNLESKADHEISLEEHPHENDISHSLSDKHPIEAGNDRYIGKVQSKLFDLSVFGIYDENTYLEMRRGKDADYSTLSGNSSEGGNLESKKADHEIALEGHPHEIASQNFLSAEPDHTADGIAGISKHSNVPNVPEGDVEGTCTKTGCYSEMPLKDPQQDCNVTGSFSEEREVKEGADSNLGDAGLWSAASGDNNFLVNALYGDVLFEKDLSSDVKPHEALEQKHMDADLIDEKRMLSSEPTDSSWVEDEDLTFASTPKEDFKLKQTTLTEKEAQAFPDTSKSGGTILARRNESEKPAFPFKRAAMKKFLQRPVHEGTAQTQVHQKVIESDVNIYEAPHVEQYQPRREKTDQGATDQALALASENNLSEAPYIEQYQSNGVMSKMSMMDPFHIESPVPELQKENSPTNAHPSPAANVNDSAMKHTQLCMNENAIMSVQSVIMEDVHSRKEFDSEKSQHRDATVDKMDQMDMERLVSVTGKGENLNAHPLPLKQGRDAARKPTSLRWKGKAVTSDTQSLSSMEVVGGDRMEYDPGRGRERDAAVMQGAVLTDEHSFLDTGGNLGRAQWQKSHNQPDIRIFSFGRTRMIEDEVKRLERQEHESEDIVGPHRAALNRPLKGRFSNSDSFDQSDVLHMEGGLSNSNSFFGQLGVDRREHTTAFQGQALQPSRSVMDEGSNYSFTGATDYYGDHSARSREVIPHPHSTEQCLSEPYGLPVGINRAYLFPVPSHGSMAPAPLQEQGFTHSAHHCVSPVCSLCIQQPYHMQQQMLQNMMLHPCAACRFQHSAAAYQPIHHDPHAHHMQLSAFSHPSLRQRETGFPPQSRRQNRLNIHRNYPSAVRKKPKLYPPLPGKGAPPYVLCEECNKMLRVPAYLPPNAGSIQKLQCGACGKVSKFSVPVQVSNQSSSKSSRSSTMDSAMNSYQNSYQVRNSPSRDKRYTDTTRVHSSEQISSLGPGRRLSASAQNLDGMARYSSGIHSQHEWVENRMLLQSNAATVADPVKESVHHGYHSTPLAGGVLGQGHFRSQVRYSEGDSLHNNAGFYSEGYLSSPPFSASGSSPGGHHEQIGQQRKVEALRRGRAGFGDRKMSHDLHARLTLNEQDGSPFEAPSFSDGFFQKDSNENRSKFSSGSLQGSVQHPFNESTCNEHVGRHQLTSKAGSWQNQSADVYFPNNSSRSTSAQLRKVPVAHGSPLIEHFTQDACDVGPGLHQRRLLQASGNGLLSAPWSPAPGSPLVDHLTHDITSGFNETSHERERPPASAQDVSRSGERERPPSAQDARKGPKYYTSLIKRSLKDLGKGGKGGDNRQKVVVNGHLITEAAVRKAEEKAGTIRPGSYWYDYQAGFWGVMGGPCLGILLPFIEEFNFPLAKDCAGGRTGILVNGRELHENDLTVLAKRGLPTICGKAYILDIYGKVFDDASGQHLISLGSLAPSIEKKGCGYGMFQLPAQP